MLNAAANKRRLCQYTKALSRLGSLYSAVRSDRSFSDFLRLPIKHQSDPIWSSLPTISLR